jgi:hypothetical protein
MTSDKESRDVRAPSLRRLSGEMFLRLHRIGLRDNV